LFKNNSHRFSKHTPEFEVEMLRCRRTAIRFNPETKRRSLDALRWGLIPYWAKDPKIMNQMINARVETVDTAPSYRQAIKKRRCLIPADGFYEWKKVLGGKIPYSISMKDGASFVFAGLWEGWKDPANDEWLHTCTIITGELNEFIREIHTRMPVILPEEHHDAWLSGEAGKEVLVPFPADRMRTWPVSPRVNSPKVCQLSICLRGSRICRGSRGNQNFSLCRHSAPLQSQS
jgi:putative SOS response-associated peptidase YedK